MTDTRVHNPRLAQLLSQLDANTASLAEKTRELKERLDLIDLPESYLRGKRKE